MNLQALNLLLKKSYSHDLNFFFVCVYETTQFNKDLCDVLNHLTVSKLYAICSRIF